MADRVITVPEVERIEKFLSSDELQGRQLFTKGIDRAAEFIATEFKMAGLKPLTEGKYFQDFSIQRTKFILAKGTLDGQSIDQRNIVAFSSKKELKLDQNSGYEKVRITGKDPLYPTLLKMLADKKNYFVLVDSIHSRMFNSLKSFRRESEPSGNNIVFVLSNTDPNSYLIEYKQDVTQLSARNVVGVLPGKKLKDQYVIFSGHYDHLGIGRPNNEGDSIYNGANDDASGITAVIMLARYFSELKNNERSLVFAAFTAEETGGYGSQYFSKQFAPEKVVAMFNIEMIGTQSRWGNNAAFITGYEKTDMGKILEKNLEGSDFSFYPDPYPKQQLFYRSDNATLARLGVPAHTVSTSRMESDSALKIEADKYYHTVDDEFETLDIKNLAEIIKAIAISSTSIVSGKDTPSRVDASLLR